MISLCDECEYTTLIADLILVLSELESFKLVLWFNGVELPLEVESKYCNLHFLQEGIKVDKFNEVSYVWYDTLSQIKVVKA